MEDAKIKLGEIAYRAVCAIFAHLHEGTMQRHGEARLAVAEYLTERRKQQS